MTGIYILHLLAQRREVCLFMLTTIVFGLHVPGTLTRLASRRARVPRRLRG